jgi:putative hydrolase of the HAD superfamily
MPGPAAAPSASIRHLLFDLDETLYPTSSGLVQEISRRMTLFVARFAGVPEEEAGRIRASLSRRYGTTLTGLMREHGLRDPEEYLTFTHPLEIERYLTKDPQLAPALAAITLPKSVLTNAPLEHALRILEFLEVRPLFERVFDIRANGYRVKPDSEVYRGVLGELQLRAQEVLFIDNRLDYLLAFRALGGKVVLVADEQVPGSEGIPRIRDVKELRGAARTLWEA